MQLSRILAVCLFGMFVISCTHQRGAQTSASQFRDDIAKLMQQAARSAGVSIIPSEIATATMGDVFIANAPVRYDVDSTLPRKTMFAYMSFGSQQCASLPSTGYYTIEQYAGSTANSNYIRLIDLNGNIVMKDIEVEHQEMQMPLKPGEPETGPTLDQVEANIMTSAKTIRTIIILHRRRHVHRQISYWEWDPSAIS